ncbi:MAG: hypothetical protein GC156_11855 [Actinomycetales bacterium]|nr:hypothetical protein [Actinomycetales bacterium]
MLIVSGALLVLLTWSGVALLSTVVGLPLSLLLHRGPMGWADVRRGLWWGLLVLAVAAYAINLVAPLGSAQAAVAVSLLAIVCAAVSAALWRRRGWASAQARTRGFWWIAAATGGAMVYLAVAALGPVTNYDSGLYHLGAIQYAAAYPTIPGLANVYFPLGYGNAEFPLAALLGNGPWGMDGFRLLNGAVIALLCLDLLIRARTSRTGPGVWVLAAGAVTVLVPMVALSDYWVTSPSQDSAVFAVTVAASALIADAVAVRRAWVAEGATAAALSVALVLLRPTMFAYAIAVLAVMVALRWRRGRAGSPMWWRAVAVLAACATVAAAVATLRDYRLSGWLQYPLSLFAFDVPWRAVDPASERIATLGYHRDPNDLWNAAHGWQWVGAWLGRLPHQWEFALVGLLALLAIGLAVVCRRRGASLRWRALLIASVPSAVMVLVWWSVTPPSFRFAWGPVFTLATVPIGWFLWRLSLPPGRRGRAMNVVAAAVAVPVLLVVAFSAVVRLDWGSITAERSWRLGISIPYAVAPVPQPAVERVDAKDGITLSVPSTGEQCWAVFPLCTPRPNPDLRLRTGSIEGGFLP